MNVIQKESTESSEKIGMNLMQVGSQSSSENIGIQVDPPTSSDVSLQLLVQQPSPHGSVNIQPPSRAGSLDDTDHSTDETNLIVEESRDRRTSLTAVIPVMREQAETAGESRRRIAALLVEGHDTRLPAAHDIEMVMVSHWELEDGLEEERNEFHKSLCYYEIDPVELAARLEAGEEVEQTIKLTHYRSQCGRLL